MKERQIIGKERITREIIEREISTDVGEDFRNVVLPKKHKFNNGGFITLFQDVMLSIAKSDLTKNELIMLFYLIGSAGIGNSINIDLDTLCSEIGDNKGNISRTLGLLVKKKIVIRATRQGSRKQGETNIYELSLNFDRISYNLAYNGKIKDFKHLQHKDPKVLVEPRNQLPSTSQLSLFE